MGFAHSFVRPAYFAENLTTTLAPELRRAGRIYLPAGRLKLDWVSVRDIAAVAAAALTGATDRPAITVASGRGIGFGPALDIVNRAAGTAFRYEPASLPGYLRHARGQGMGWGMIGVMLLLHFLPRFSRQDLAPRRRRSGARPAAGDAGRLGQSATRRRCARLPGCPRGELPCGSDVAPASAGRALAAARPQHRLDLVPVDETVVVEVHQQHRLAFRARAGRSRAPGASRAPGRGFRRTRPRRRRRCRRRPIRHREWRIRARRGVSPQLMSACRSYSAAADPAVAVEVVLGIGQEHPGAVGGGADLQRGAGADHRDRAGRRRAGRRPRRRPAAAPRSRVSSCNSTAAGNGTLAGSRAVWAAAGAAAASARTSVSGTGNRVMAPGLARARRGRQRTDP